MKWIEVTCGNDNLSWSEVKNFPFKKFFFFEVTLTSFWIAVEMMFTTHFPWKWDRSSKFATAANILKPLCFPNKNPSFQLQFKNLSASLQQNHLESEVLYFTSAQIVISTSHFSSFHFKFYQSLPKRMKCGFDVQLKWCWIGFETQATVDSLKNFTNTFSFSN